MSPVVAACFTLAGVALVMMGKPCRSNRCSLILACLGMLVGGTGAAALFGYCSGIKAMYGWGPVTDVAANSALGLVLLGSGIFFKAWQEALLESDGSPRWLPLPTACALTVFSVVLWRAVSTEGTGIPDRLGYIILAFGLGGSALLSSMIFLAQRARREHRFALHEIAERRQVEQALRQSEECFRSFVEAAPEGIFVHSEGHFVFINPVMLKLLGASQPEELLGTEIMVRIAPEYHEAARERIRMQCDTGQTTPSMDQEYIRIDGLRIAVEITAAPVSYQGRKAHLVFVRDIARRKQLEQQLRQSQKMESVGQLAAGIAHDFHNILTVIQGHVALLQESVEKSSEQADSLAQIDTAAERCAGLTRQLLTFSRRQIMQQEVLDLNVVVTNVAVMLRRVLGEHISLLVIPSSDPPLVRADRGMMEQILVNLTVNSRDAMSGGGDLTISAGVVVLDQAQARQQAESHPGKFVWLAVSDTGSGIGPDVLPLIFEPFFTTKDVGKGTGLGLATVYGIVKQHAGWIQVTSTVGKGTTFQVFLPWCGPAD